ncbi:MAG: putative ligase-like protein [Acidimicrobiaceae bacterium]|nr:putative ligase-like protein [Acidimicrobiaceae bacterium]
MSPERTEVDIEGRRLSLSNLDKVLFPKTGFTKGALIDYYARIAPAMLPHLRDRAVTFRRFPNGVESGSFFEKNAPSHAPEWVRTTRVLRAEGERSRRGKEASAEIEYALVCDVPTLVWAANLATIEFHVPLWRVRDGEVEPANPDHLVFDLDPGPGTSIVECCRVAGWLAALLEREGLGPVLPKTSGSKGLQLYVPLPAATGWDAARERALSLGQAVERDHPELVVTNMRKELRQGKVLIDWSQNHPAKTTVAVYSVRARPEPTVSTPVTWAEVADCEQNGYPESLRFLPEQVLSRVERDGDLMAELVTSH